MVLVNLKLLLNVTENAALNTNALKQKWL